MTLYRVELNGRAAGPAVLQELAFAGYGHFTSMQVRDHRVRGLDLHVERLRRDSRALFGRAVDGGRVLGYLRQVTDGLPGALSVQVNVFSQDERAVEAGRAVEPDVLARAGPPAEAGTAPVRVQTRTHERLLPAPASLDDPPRLPRRPA